MQIAGFAAVFALFLACGLAFYSLTATTKALQGFQAMYYISSFFAQFVNATTFLLVSSHSSTPCSTSVYTTVYAFKCCKTPPARQLGPL